KSRPGTVAAHHPPFGRNRENENRGGSLALAEPERGPHQYRDADKADRIILDSGKGAAEDQNPEQSHRSQRHRGFEQPSTIADQSWILDPQDRKRREHQKAAYVAQPPGQPDSYEFVPVREPAKRETRNAESRADCRREHPQRGELEKILRTFEKLAAVRVAHRQVHRRNRFER